MCTLLYTYNMFVHYTTKDHSSIFPPNKLAAISALSRNYLKRKSSTFTYFNVYVWLIVSKREPPEHKLTFQTCLVISPWSVDHEPRSRGHYTFHLILVFNVYVMPCRNVERSPASCHRGVDYDKATKVPDQSLSVRNSREGRSVIRHDDTRFAE